MITVLKRPPHDLFTFRLFYSLTHDLKHSDCIYSWSTVLEPTYYHGNWDTHGAWIEEFEIDYRNQLLDAIAANVVVLGIKDHLTVGDFDPWTDKIPKSIDYLSDLFAYYSNKKFILLTSLENLQSYISNSNVVIVPWGGDITNQYIEYKKLSPVVDKNFNSTYNYISLNRNQRSHRAFLVSLLHTKNLAQQGLISCMFKDDIEDILEYLNWPLDIEMQQSVVDGFELLKTSKILLEDPKNIYVNSANDNVGNFNNNLRACYKDVFVEIITETSCTEMCFNITEKTLNSVYGCNFPIFISSPGAVAFLRGMGLDVFDDVVDHSYDLIENPIDRICQAVYNNKKLLTDNQYIKQMWHKNQHRFASNVEFVKNDMYEYYRNRAVSKFKDCVNA